MLRTLFTPRVQTLRFAGDAEEALAMLAEGGVTHLLIDHATVAAEDCDVVEAIRALTRASAGAASTILRMSPHSETESQLEEAGIDQVIEKPVSGKALIEAVIPLSEQNPKEPGPDLLATRAA